MAPDEEDDDDEHHHEKPKEDASAANYRMSMESARLDFIPEAIMVLADYGQEAESRKLYAKLVAERPTGQTWEEFVNSMLSVQAKTEYGDQANTQQILLGLELLTLAVFAIVAIVKGHSDNPAGHVGIAASWFSPFALNWSALVDGVLLAVFIYWGWDSGVAVNDESEDSRHGPGKAAVGACGPNVSASRTPSQWSGLSGAWNLRSPSGGLANGMPRKTALPCSTRPLTRPALVETSGSAGPMGRPPATSVER